LKLNGDDIKDSELLTERSVTNKKVKIPGAFKKAYTGSSFEVINPNNYLDWIS